MQPREFVLLACPACGEFIQHETEFEGMTCVGPSDDAKHRRAKLQLVRAREVVDER